MPLVEIPFVVEANYDGWRLDRYLQQKLGRASRAQVQRIIRDSLVQEGERVLKPASRVTGGLRLRILKEEAEEPSGLPDTVPVLFDQEDVLVLDKPAGLPVHPTARYFRGTVTTILGRDHRDESGKRPDPAHRLDRETSGVLVCGRTRRMTRALKAFFAGNDLPRPMEKRYLALVEGDAPWESRRIEHALALTGEHRVRIRMSVVPPEHPSAQPAATTAKVLARYAASGGARFTLLECSLESGRQHQIRAHLQAEGLPLVGDKIYGHDETVFIRFTEGALTEGDQRLLRLSRHALHASSIAFPHPESGRPLRIEAPLPRDLRAFIDELKQVA